MVVRRKVGLPGFTVRALEASTGVVAASSEACISLDVVQAVKGLAATNATVTGDDEDNILICQVAKEKYGIDRIIARVNNPSNRAHFDLLGIKPVVSATELILRLLEHEVPHHNLVHLLDLEEEEIEIIEIRLGAKSPVVGRTVGELNTPDNTLVIAVIRDGRGMVPNASTVFEEGDDILAVLDPQREEELKALFTVS